MNERNRFLIVVNAEGQHSVWPVETPIPLGWTLLGIEGSWDECLGQIDRMWTDLRPLSARRDNGVPRWI